MPNHVRKVRYEEMLPHEAVRARQECPVAYLPVGGIEWHGEHNALGLDTIKVQALAMRCAESAGGLVFPPLFYGEPREHYLMEASQKPDDLIKEKMCLPPEDFYPGYMDERQTEADMFYVRLLLHILKEIRSLGFKAIVIIAGHYPLLNHSRAAAEIFNLEIFNLHARASSRAIAWAVTGYELVRDVLPAAGDHAAAWETSLMMALRPELVDMSRLPSASDAPLVGVYGQDPRVHASREYGENGIRLVVERIAEKVDQLLRDLGA